MLVQAEDSPYLVAMDHTEINVGGEYVWRTANGQTLRAIVTEAPTSVRTGVAPDNEVWTCKVRLPDAPRQRPDSTAPVSELHEG